jgi:hypothetical protein
MSDTPETDEALFDYDSQCEYWVDAEFARKLERERNALKKQLSEIDAWELLKEARAEIAELKKENQTTKYRMYEALEDQERMRTDIKKAIS